MSDRKKRSERVDPSLYDLASDVIRAQGLDPDKLDEGERFKAVLRHIFAGAGATHGRKESE